jgi:hypothetical protein
MIIYREFCVGPLNKSPLKNLLNPIINNFLGKPVIISRILIRKPYYEDSLVKVLFREPMEEADKEKAVYARRKVMTAEQISEKLLELVGHPHAEIKQVSPDWTVIENIPGVNLDKFNLNSSNFSTIAFELGKLLAASWIWGNSKLRPKKILVNGQSLALYDLCMFLIPELGEPFLLANSLSQTLKLPTVISRKEEFIKYLREGFIAGCKLIMENEMKAKELVRKAVEKNVRVGYTRVSIPPAAQHVLTEAELNLIVGRFEFLKSSSNFGSEIIDEIIRLSELQ